MAPPHSHSSQISREPVGRCSPLSCLRVVLEASSKLWAHPWLLPMAGGCCRLQYLALLWVRSCVEVLMHMHLLCGVSSSHPSRYFETAAASVLGSSPVCSS